MRKCEMGRTKIKICGLRRPEDIAMVNRQLPDYGGFICSAGFSRSVTMQTLHQLSRQMDHRIQRVGVFVDDGIDQISSYVEEGLIDIVQLHGHEDASYLFWLRKRLPSGFPLIKAFQIRSGEEITAAKQCTADYVLLDGGQGSGQSFDWSFIRNIGREYFLAGGLNPENIKKAVDVCRPYAVDISSGVETNGWKDESKIRACVEYVRKDNR